MADHRLLAVALALALTGAALAGPTAIAQDEDAEEPEDADEAEDSEEERSVEVETEGKDVTIELKRETGAREDEVEMAWTAEEATFELGYETENETREIERKLEAVFGAVAEYRDANDDGSYDPGEELVSGTVLGEEHEDAEDLGIEGEAEWRDPTVEDITHEGHDGKQITSSADLADGGQLELRFLVFGEDVNLEGTNLAPTGAKIDIVVENYTYQSDDTDLAIFLETETENELEQEDSDEETGVAAVDDQARLVFTWKDQVQVDGDTHDVATTVLSEETETENDEEEAEHETERSFVLSYPRGDEIVHDPRAEVLLQSGAQADVPPPALPAALAALAASALLARRRW